jgi:adenylylsulfate kinase-like enzyme
MTPNKSSNKCFSLWLIGPSGSGKTVISKIIYNKLIKYYSSLIILDGDQARKIYLNVSGFDPVSRSKNIHQYATMAKWLSSFGVSSIVAAINAFEKDRNFCRKEIKNYKEVYLKCSLEERIKRDKKKLYLPAIKGEKKNVIDVDIPFENPKNSNLIINSERTDSEIIANNIIKKLKLI